MKLFADHQTSDSRIVTVNQRFGLAVFSRVGPGHRHWRAYLAFCGAALAIAASAAPQAPAPSQRPNILLILADDLGYSDLGAFGGEIHTPNLDRLALAGVRLTDFQAAPTCAPTRAALLTGVDHHWAGHGTLPGSQVEEQVGKPGYEGNLNSRVRTVAQALQAAGYATAMAGKWHLGKAAESTPKSRGFDRSFAMTEGSGNHYFDSRYERPEGQTTYTEDGKRVPAPVGNYSSDYFTDRLLGFLDENHAERRPFFAYLAFSAPHWPLHAPEASVAKYHGQYADGPLALQARRLARVKALGLVAPDAKPFPMETPLDWSGMTPDERGAEARRMEVYAGMVDRMDENVGRVVEWLRAHGELDNTLIIFLSDNGPEGIELDASPFQGRQLKAWMAQMINNTTDNIGRASSFTWYGHAWAQATNPPFRGYKAYTTEGGTRVPAFITGLGVGRSGQISSSLALVTDITPTILQAAGVRPEQAFSQDQVRHLAGRSLSAFIAGRARRVHDASEAVGVEQFFRRGLRKGDWKAVYEPKGRRLYYDPDGTPSVWMLFNLKADPGETRDLARTYPAKLDELKQDWAHYAARNGVVVRPALAPPDEGAGNAQRH